MGTCSRRLYATNSKCFESHKNVKTFVRVIQYGLLALFIHFGDKTIFGQQKPKTEFFKTDQVDSFDEIAEKLMKVNEDNCGIKHVGDLYLSDDTVSHKPNIKEININPVLPNRTDMLHIHNMALSRSFFFSFILQARFNRPTANETYDPGLMYYYLSTIADVAANPRVNASAIYFSPNMSYSPSYRGFFNLSMPLFAPRTFRADDYNDPIHLERISTLNKFVDTAKCKKESTFCEPLHGYGFRRGGYQCRCNPNHRLPNIVRRPYLGEIIERASETQFKNPNTFQCPKVGFIQKLPVQKTKSPKWMQSQYTEKYYEYTNFSSEPEDGWNLDSLHQRKETGSTRINADEVLNFIHSVDHKNCHTKTAEELNLKGDISFGAEEQFRNEAHMAVRTANFISSFLQVVDPG